MFPMSYDTAHHLVTDRRTQSQAAATRHRASRPVDSDPVAAAPETPAQLGSPITLTGWRRVWRWTRRRAIA